METEPIRPGDKIHIVERRRFDSGLRRYFAGEVVATAGNVIRARGYVFVLNSTTGLLDKRSELRTRLFSANDANNSINFLAGNVDLERVRYAVESRHLIVTDDQDPHRAINEFGGAR